MDGREELFVRYTDSLSVRCCLNTCYSRPDIQGFYHARVLGPSFAMCPLDRLRLQCRQ